MGLKWATQAKRLNLRKASKYAGFHGSAIPSGPWLRRPVTDCSVMYRFFLGCASCTSARTLVSPPYR
jgi:hypothetical protein